METNTLNIVLGILTVLSIIITFISEKYRLISIVITFIFIIIIIISMQQINISDIQKEQNKLKEKLNIHQQLIDIKAELKSLRQDGK